MLKKFLKGFAWAMGAGLGLVFMFVAGWCIGIVMVLKAVAVP